MPIILLDELLSLFKKGSSQVVGGGKARAGKYKRSWRPGRRSLEKKLRKTFRAKPGAGLKAGKVIPKPSPRIVKIRKPAMALKGRTATVGELIDALYPGEEGLRTAIMNGDLKVEEDGEHLYIMGQDVDPLDAEAEDAGYVPNGEVWLTQAPMQLYWDHIQDALWGDISRLARARDPITLPDGTPLIGHIWLPKRNIEVVNPNLYHPFTFTTSTRPLSKGGKWTYELRGAERLANQEMLNHYGFAAIAMPDGWYAGVSNLHPLHSGTGLPHEKGLWSELPQFSPYGPRAFRSPNTDDGPDGAIFRYWNQFQWKVNFDWSVKDPITQAYPWWFLNVGSDLPGFSVVPADFWRSDLQDIGNGFPDFMPGPPWLFACIEFLDYLATGQHGLPQLITSEGTLDPKAFIDWAISSGWWPSSDRTRLSRTQLKRMWERGPFVLATIYDVPGIQTAYLPPVPPPQLPLPPDEYQEPYQDPLRDQPYDTTVAPPSPFYVNPSNTGTYDEEGEPYEDSPTSEEAEEMEELEALGSPLATVDEFSDQ